MPATVHHNSMGRKTVVTTDKYGTERVYKFRPAREGVGVEPQDGYTPVVLKALWDEGVPVEWSPDELTASQRAELNGFCDACGTAEANDQVGANEWVTYCPACEDESAVKA